MASSFFDQARGEPPAAPLFIEDGGTTWRTHMWARHIRAAISSHNERAKEDKALTPLPVLASAYSFRHARISELLQVYAIDPLTVAAQTGTSLAMIERAYLRYRPSTRGARVVASWLTSEPHAKESRVELGIGRE